MPSRRGWKERDEYGGRVEVARRMLEREGREREIHVGAVRFTQPVGKVVAERKVAGNQ